MRSVFVTFCAMAILLGGGCTISHRIQEVSPPPDDPPLTDLDEQTDGQSPPHEHTDTSQSSQ